MDKVFIGFATILLLFYGVFSGGVGDHDTCGILAPRPGIKLAPLALKGEVLTTGPPGKSLYCFLIKRHEETTPALVNTAEETTQTTP